MWFETKKVRVKFPCPPYTLVEEEPEPAAAVLPDPQARCPHDSCHHLYTPIQRFDGPEIFVVGPADLPVLEAAVELQLEQTKLKLQQIQHARQVVDAQKPNEP